MLPWYFPYVGLLLLNYFHKCWGDSLSDVIALFATVKPNHSKPTHHVRVYTLVSYCIIVWYLVDLSWSELLLTSVLLWAFSFKQLVGTGMWVHNSHFQNLFGFFADLQAGCDPVLYIHSAFWGQKRSQGVLAFLIGVNLCEAPLTSFKNDLRNSNEQQKKVYGQGKWSVGDIKQSHTMKWMCIWLHASK